MRPERETSCHDEYFICEPVPAAPRGSAGLLGRITQLSPVKTGSGLASCPTKTQHVALVCIMLIMIPGDTGWSSGPHWSGVHYHQNWVQRPLCAPAEPAVDLLKDQNLAGTRVGRYITIFMFWSGPSQAWWNQSSAFGPGLGLRGVWFWKTEDVLNTRVSELWPDPALDRYRTRTSSPILEYGSGSGPCLVPVLLPLRLLAEGCMLLRRLWVQIMARFSSC